MNWIHGGGTAFCNKRVWTGEITDEIRGINRQDRQRLCGDLPDLPGCIAAADTFEETWQLIQEAANYHVELMAEHGETIPEPLNVAVEVDVQIPAPAAP